MVKHNNKTNKKLTQPYQTWESNSGHQAWQSDTLTSRPPSAVNQFNCYNVMLENKKETKAKYMQLTRFQQRCFSHNNIF